MQIEVFEVVLEDVIRPISNNRAFLVAECLSDPNNPYYFVIITKYVANLPFLCLETNLFGTEHLSFHREDLANLL